MRPSHTTVASSRLGADFRLKNVDNNTDDEFIELLAFGTTGYILQAIKTGAGVVRDFKIRANGIDAMTFGGITNTITIGNGMNIPLGTSTGTMIGTATTQKMGFFGKTPIAQPGAIASPDTSGAQLKTAVDAIRTALTNLGLTA